MVENSELGDAARLPGTLGCIVTYTPHYVGLRVVVQSGRRELNPQLQLGKLPCYRYTTPAY